MTISRELSEKLIRMFQEEDDALEVVETGSWEQDHKYQMRVSIVKYDDVHYGIQESRTGSYHTDWYYDDPIVTGRVMQKQVTTTQWVAYKE